MIPIARSSFCSSPPSAISVPASIRSSQTRCLIYLGQPDIRVGEEGGVRSASPLSRLEDTAGDAVRGASMSTRVVVTGIGLITPLGLTTSSTWKALIAGETAVKYVEHHPSIPIKVAAQIDRSALPSVPPLLSPCPEFATFALLAAREALLDASLLTADPEDDLRGKGYDPTRAGTSIGVGIGQIQDIVSASATLAAGKYRRVSPFLVPRLLPNTPAGLIALRHRLRGPVLSPATACAAGAHALGDAFHAIRRGDVDLMLAGGTEAVVGPLAIAGFARARALTARFNDEPHKASRPFDIGRDGFVIAEGAGVLVLEAEEHARRRGVEHVYAELVGVGATGDAHHITSPAPDGDGAVRAMRAALSTARRKTKEVDYVNAHATSTPVGDAVERRAIASLLDAREVGERAVVSATKGATGHMLGAAGAVEGAFSALAVAEGVVPPTVNLDDVDEDEEAERCGWGKKERYVPNEAREMEVRLALSNSFGFGGTNCCVAFARADGFGRKTTR